MNPHTGELVDDIQRVPLERRADFVQVPDELNRAARRALGGRAETTVDLDGNCELARFAREQRNKTTKAKRKTAKASRKANRRR